MMLCSIIPSIEYPSDGWLQDETAFRKGRINMKNRRDSDYAPGTHFVTSREMAAFEEPWWSCNVHDGGGQVKLEQSNSPVQSLWKVKDQSVGARDRVLLLGSSRAPPKKHEVEERLLLSREILETSWKDFVFLAGIEWQDVSQVTWSDVRRVAMWRGSDTCVAWHPDWMNIFFKKERPNRENKNIFTK